MTEFALILPPFLLLLFALLELGLLMETRSAYDEAAQQAVRVAATAGRAGNADAQMLATFQQQLPEQNLKAVSSVTVFDATASGALVNPQAQTTYVYQNGQFVCQWAPSATPPVPCPVPTPGTHPYWNPLSRNTTVGQLDHIGLQVAYTYQGLGKIIPALHLTTSAVTVVEPQMYVP